MSRTRNSPVRIPRGEEKTPVSRRLAAAREGKELPVTLGDMMDVEVGETPGLDVRAVHDLARAIHRAESTACSVSWSAQERARAFRNAHGFDATLAEIVRLTALDATR